MREILFRGKTKSGEWIEGNYVKAYDYGHVESIKHLIFSNSSYYGYDGYTNDEEVIPETVGQFTGLTDKNGEKIFEGDIVRVNKDGDILEIMYCERGYFCANNNAWWEFIDELGAFEVIGNIHDNPELLEVK